MNEQIKNIINAANRLLWSMRTAQGSQTIERNRFRLQHAIKAIEGKIDEMEIEQPEKPESNVCQSLEDWRIKREILNQKQYDNGSEF